MKKYLLVAAAACATGGALHPKDLNVAHDQVAALLGAEHEALGRGDFAAVSSLMTPDVTWIGPSVEQSLGGTAAVKTALEQHLGGKKLALTAGASNIGVAADGHAGWASEDVKLSIDGGEPMSVRHTLFAVDDGKAWKIAAEEFSVGLPNEKAFELAAAGKLAQPDPLVEAVPANAADLVAAWKREMADPAAWAQAFPPRSDATVFGSAPDEIVVGGAEIQQRFAAQVTKYKIQMEPLGPQRAGVAPSGSAGFVAANISFSVDPGDGKRVTEPYRVLLVYLKDRGEWRPVHAHFSNGM